MLADTRTLNREEQKFQRFFTCKRIFPLRVSRLNNTPVSRVRRALLSWQCSLCKDERRSPAALRGCMQRKARLWETGPLWRTWGCPPSEAPRPLQTWRKICWQTLGTKQAGLLRIKIPRPINPFSFMYARVNLNRPYFLEQL